MDPTSYVKYASPQSRVREVLRKLGGEIYSRTKRSPAIFIVILPEGGNEIYTEVKQCVFFLLFSPSFLIIYEVLEMLK